MRLDLAKIIQAINDKSLTGATILNFTCLDMPDVDFSSTVGIVPGYDLMIWY